MSYMITIEFIVTDFYIIYTSMIINLAEEYVSYMIIDRLSRIVDRSELYKHILKKNHVLGLFYP